MTRCSVFSTVQYFDWTMGFYWSYTLLLKPPVPMIYYTVMHMLLPSPCSPPGWRTSQRRSTERLPTDCTWSRRDRRESYRSSGPPLLPLPPPATPLHTPHRGIHVAFTQGKGEGGFCVTPWSDAMAIIFFAAHFCASTIREQHLFFRKAC